MSSSILISIPLALRIFFPSSNKETQEKRSIEGPQTKYLPSNSKKFCKIMKLPMNISTYGHRAFYWLYNTQIRKKKKKEKKIKLRQEAGVMMEKRTKNIWREKSKNHVKLRKLHAILQLHDNHTKTALNWGPKLLERITIKIELEKLISVYIDCQAWSKRRFHFFSTIFNAQPTKSMAIYLNE